MTMMREVVRKVDHFDRAQAFTTTPAGEFGWTIADTSAVGAPTAVCVTADGGRADLTLAATSELENLCLFQNDVLPFDLAKIDYVAFDLSVAGVDAVTTIGVGLGSARNDALDSVAINALFRIEGSVDLANVVVETDDGVTDKDDKATGKTLGSTPKRCRIDLTNGLSDVRFFIDGDRVAAGETFSLAGITAGQNVQLMAQVQKASGTGVPSLKISKVDIQYKTADGA